MKIRMDNGQMIEGYSTLETWDECFDKLHDTKDFADTTIVVRPGPKQVSLKAHKFVLYFASREFCRIVNELDRTESNSIIIEDAEPEDVEMMLSYVYERKCIFSSVEQSLNVLSLAVRYQLSRLQGLCSRYIEHRLQTNNACEIYQRALSLQQLELIYKSLECVKKETSKVLKETELSELKSSTLGNILGQEILNIHSEFELLETLIKWGKSQLKVRCEDDGSDSLREIVYPFLKHIRFLCIRREKFAEIQHKTKIFSDEEVGKIMMRYFFTDSSDLPEWFNSLTRPRTYDNDIVITSKNTPILRYRHYSWSNVNHKPYCCSQFEKKITSKFMAKEKDFFIRSFLISMCKECAYRNTKAGRYVIEAKIAVVMENLVRENCCQLYALSGRFSFDYHISKDIYKYEPLVLKQKFATQRPLSYNQSLGVDAPPTLNAYIDGDMSKLTVVTETSCLLPSLKVKVDPPIYVRSGQIFSLTVESEKPFYSCRSVPLFDTSPFSVFSEATTDPEYLFVWCSFDSIQCILANSKESMTAK